MSQESDDSDVLTLVPHDLAEMHPFSTSLPHFGRSLGHGRGQNVLLHIMEKVDRGSGPSCSSGHGVSNRGFDYMQLAEARQDQGTGFETVLSTSQRQEKVKG